MMKTKRINNFQLVNANPNDQELYYQIKKSTCEKYVNEFFGGWNEEEQIKYNNKIFVESLNQTYFKLIKLNKQPIGFFGYSIFDKEIGCVTLQIIEISQRNDILISLLTHLIELSKKLSLPIYAKSFLSSQDIEIYKSIGFEIINTTKSHYQLKYKE